MIIKLMVIKLLMIMIFIASRNNRKIKKNIVPIKDINSILKKCVRKFI